MSLDDDTLRRLLAALQHGEVRITGGVLTGDARAAAAYCDLCAAAPALADEVLRLRGLISEQCAAIETGPTRRRIPGCQTVGPCYVCDYPQTATAPGRELGGGGGETDGGDVQTPRQ